MMFFTMLFTYDQGLIMWWFYINEQRKSFQWVENYCREIDKKLVLWQIQKSVAAISKMLRINLTISDFEMDYLSLNNNNEIDEIPIPAKIIGVVIYLLGLLGISSILGILHYEKFGQDSQKRSFADQLFSFNCIIFMIIYPMMLTIDQLRWFHGPIGYTLAISKQYLASCLLCIPLGFTESILFRLLMIYSWTHPPSP